MVRTPNILNITGEASGETYLMLPIQVAAIEKYHQLEHDISHV